MSKPFDKVDKGNKRGLLYCLKYGDPQLDWIGKLELVSWGKIVVIFLIQTLQNLPFWYIFYLLFLIIFSNLNFFSFEEHQVSLPLKLLESLLTYILRVCVRKIFFFLNEV